MGSDELRSKIDTVSKDFLGILPYYEAFYIESIVRSSNLALLSYERFLIQVWRSSDSETYSSFHEFLFHAAATSRYFWPATPLEKELRPLTSARGVKLRTAFSLPESSPLKNRDMRNFIEHYDEKLDRFLLTDPIGVLLPQPIISADNLGEDNQGHVFQFVNPVYGYAVIFGHRFEYLPLFEEVQRVSDLARSLYEDGGSLHPKAATPSSS